MYHYFSTKLKDFSAKQQKRITTNENEITKLNSELIKANENINDVKNNWFNIETSPLWKKVENNNIETFKWYFIKISYQYSTENDFMKFYKVIKIYLNNVFNEFELLNVDSMTYKEQISNKNILNIGTIYYNNRNKTFSGGGNSYPERGKINLIGDIEEIYQYQGIHTPTEFIAEESTERDYYTKLETNNLLDKKQNKLIAGENITIDENNKISATGGGVDPNNYYTKPEIDKKLEDVKSQFPIAFQLNAVSQEIPNLETTNKTIVGAINENKANIDKKQDKENWKIIGKSISNREYAEFKLNFNTLYRTIITWEKPPFNQVNLRFKVEFKTGNYLGGSPNDKIFLTKGLINDEEAILYLQFLAKNKWQLIIEGGNEEYGNIYSLEELQNTIKIDINQQLKITSKSLKVNELAENNFDIELPENPPNPNNQKWKVVGTREKNKWDNWQINYDFIVNKRYRVYYSWSIYNPVYTIQEFIITDNKIAGVPIQTFNDSVNIVILSVQHAKLITIYSGKGNLKGNVWKLEELQE